MPIIEVTTKLEISKKELEKHVLDYISDRFLIGYTWNPDGTIGEWRSGYQDQMEWIPRGTVTPLHSAAKLLYNEIAGRRGG